MRSLKSTHELDARLKKGMQPTAPPPSKHKPYFKDHFPAVVGYVYLSRYVSGDHVFCRFPDHFGTKRTCERHLSQLVELGHLSIVRPTPEPTFPNVYTTTGKGRSLVKREFGWEIPPNIRDEVKELSNILHELYLTDFELYLWQAIQARDDLALAGLTERRYNLKGRQLEFTHQGSRIIHRPDAGFLLAQTMGSETKLLFHLVEMDMATESLPTVHKKLLTYDNWSHSTEGIKQLQGIYQERGRENAEPKYRLLVLVSDRKQSDFNRLLNLYVKTLELPPATRNCIWLTTMEDIEAARRSSDSAPLLAQPIWYRGREAMPWIEEYRTFAAQLTRGRGHKPEKHKKTYVAEKLARMERAYLLPKLSEQSQTTLSPEHPQRHQA